MYINTSIAIILAFIYSLSLSFSSWLNIFSFLPCLFVFILAKEKMKVLKYTLFLNIFIVMISINYLWAGESEYALFLFLRANLILLFTFCIFYDKSATQVAISAAKFGLGSKLSMILFLSCKFIKELQNELVNFTKRSKARNFRAKTTIFTYKTYANFIGLIVLFAFEKAGRSLNCMRVRNFNLKTFVIADNRWSKGDLVLLTLILVLIFFHFLGQIYGLQLRA